MVLRRNLLIVVTAGFQKFVNRLDGLPAEVILSRPRSEYSGALDELHLADDNDICHGEPQGQQGTLPVWRVPERHSELATTKLSLRDLGPIRE